MPSAALDSSTCCRPAGHPEPQSPARDNVAWALRRPWWTLLRFTGRTPGRTRMRLSRAGCQDRSGRVGSVSVAGAVDPAHSVLRSVSGVHRTGEDRAAAGTAGPGLRDRPAAGPITVTISRKLRRNAATRTATRLSRRDCAVE